MQSSNSLVTVLMPVFNGEKYLSEAIESILAQTYKDYEFLIINDGSNDNSINIIKSYNDSRINLVENRQNLGLTATLNKGIKIAKGQYIARLDQDDISKKSRLTLQVEYLVNNSDTVLLGSNCQYINSNNDIIGRWETCTDHIGIINSFHKHNPFAHSSVMFDRNKIIKLGGYPENYVYAQDLALWIKVCSHYRVANISNYITKIRIHDDQTGMNINMIKTKLFEKIKLIIQTKKIKLISKRTKNRLNKKLWYFGLKF